VPVLVVVAGAVPPDHEGQTKPEIAKRVLNAMFNNVILLVLSGLVAARVVARCQLLPSTLSRPRIPFPPFSNYDGGSSSLRAWSQGESDSSRQPPTPPTPPTPPHTRCPRWYAPASPPHGVLSQVASSTFTFHHAILRCSLDSPTPTLLVVCRCHL
jgi:hypothetical protein